MDRRHCRRYFTYDLVSILNYTNLENCFEKYDINSITRYYIQIRAYGYFGKIAHQIEGFRFGGWPLKTKNRF